MDYPKSVPSAGLVNGRFVDENPLTGTPGSLIPADWGNGVTQELLAVITAADLTPSEANLTQLLSAIRSISRKSAGLGIQRFTANGSFTVPEGVTKIWLSGCAGGGGAAPAREARVRRLPVVAAAVPGSRLSAFLSP
ncbi:Prophage tail fiber protein [Pseudomonas chlororaphis subsp. aurantiaca]|nr:Prophage tail fiber protein [Pseudomonas chlororaphis subsp. aurantiaca]